QRRFVDQIGEVRAGEARRQAGDLVEIHVGCETNLLRVHSEDLRTPDPVRTIDEHLTIEAPGTKQRGIEYFGTVRRGEQDQAMARIEAVHFDQKLGPRL